MVKMHYFTSCQGLLTHRDKYYIKEENKMSATHTVSHLPPLRFEFPIGNTTVNFTIVVQYLCLLLTLV